MFNIYYPYLKEVFQRISPMALITTVRFNIYKSNGGVVSFHHP